MTERKPLGMSFTSWIDEQIQEAAERGAFDDLPGAGKPIPNHGDEDAAQAWIREHIRKEGIPAEDLLPTPLRLRKESARLSENVPTLPSEAAVRETVADLNGRIMEWRRIPIGPPIFVPLVDEEAMVTRWREGQPAAGAPPADDAPEPASSPATVSWWRRRRRHQP
jgi:Domain of unknown function (DUF1992)